MRKKLYKFALIVVIIRIILEIISGNYEFLKGIPIGIVLAYIYDENYDSNHNNDDNDQ